MNGVLLVADMEGCIGKYDARDYAASRDSMMSDIITCVRSLQANGYCNIAVVDCHDSGHNVDEITTIVPSIKHVSHIWNVTDWKQYNVAFLIGFHAKNGVKDLHSHTLRPEIRELLLGDKSIGEIEWLINTLAYYGVKTKGVTGIGGARPEVESLGIPFFQTKSVSSIGAMQEVDRADLCAFIAQALVHETHGYEYDDSRIEVVFRDKKTVDWVPPGLFHPSESNPGIVFENTLVFNKAAYGMCKFLNAGRDYQMHLTNRIRTICRENYTKSSLSNISNLRFQYLLNEKKYEELTIRELWYVITEIEGQILRIS